MPTLAFWNTNGSVAPRRIAAFAHECDADVLILAEAEDEVSEILRELNRGASRLYFSDIGESDRLVILTRFEPDVSVLIRDSFGVSIRHYRTPLSDSFLVVAVHLGSKLWSKTEDQILASTRLARLIKEAEENVRHARTVIIGDLNMNPFEVGVVGSEGLHGMMDRRIAAAVSRVVRGEPCGYFYNPMWGKFGNRGDSPPGTYFYNSATEVNYFWNMFDQILVRPALLDFLSEDGVSIVTEIEGETLLTNSGRPNVKAGSDHLPIMCRLDEIEVTTNA